MAIDSFAAFINTDGVVFPDNAAVNSTGAGLFDGTEFVALMVNNYLFGPQQALLNRAGIIPSGVVESDAASQTIEAMHKAFNIGPGMRQMSDLNVTETAKYRMLPLNRQGVLRASYPDLDTATYVGDATNTAVQVAGGSYYRADDAAGVTPNIVGIYLILPETRGYVPRGLDVAATVDPLGATRVLGDNQVDAMQRITGDAGRLDAWSGAITGNGALSLTSTSTQGPTTSTTPNYILGFDSANSVSPNTAKTDDVETRAANISTNYVVGY